MCRGARSALKADRALFLRKRMYVSQRPLFIAHQACEGPCLKKGIFPCLSGGLAIKPRTVKTLAPCTLKEDRASCPILFPFPAAWSSFLLLSVKKRSALAFFTINRLHPKTALIISCRETGKIGFYEKLSATPLPRVALCHLGHCPEKFHKHGHCLQPLFPAAPQDRSACLLLYQHRA